MSIVTLNGETMHTSGELPKVGSQAPDFAVTKIDLAEVRLKNYLGNKIILNIFPSLDTTVCASAMLKFNEIAKQEKKILILCISADLPFAQKRFCSAEHLANVLPVSVFRHPQFAKDYGVLITDGPMAGLLARALIVVDEKGKIKYAEQVSEITQQADYEAMRVALNTESETI